LYAEGLEISPKYQKILDNQGANVVILIEYIGVLGISDKQHMGRIPEEFKMLTLANSDYLPQRDLRIWVSAKSGL
jgi:hypothetical protein